MCDFYSLGSSPPYFYLVTKQVMTTGLIIDQKFITRSELGSTFDLRPSEVDQLLSTGRLIINDHWYVATVTLWLKNKYDCSD